MRYWGLMWIFGGETCNHGPEWANALLRVLVMWCDVAWCNHVYIICIYNLYNIMYTYIYIYIYVIFIWIHLFIHLYYCKCIAHVPGDHPCRIFGYMASECATLSPAVCSVLTLGQVCPGRADDFSNRCSTVQKWIMMSIYIYIYIHIIFKYAHIHTHRFARTYVHMHA